MMRRWHFFDLATGEFVDRVYCASNDSDLDRATPAGCEAIEGTYDPLAQRVDIGDSPGELNGKLVRAVVDWVNTKRIDAIAKHQAVSAARARIAELEGRQLRTMREDRLRPNERDPTDNKTPREKLQAIDDEIASLRAVINGGTDTSAP